MSFSPHSLFSSYLYPLPLRHFETSQGLPSHFIKTTGVLFYCQHKVIFAHSECHLPLLSLPPCIGHTNDSFSRQNSCNILPFKFLSLHILHRPHQYVYLCLHISERSSSTKLKLNESTKRNAWLSLRDTSPWRATNSEECDVIWRS